MTRRQTPHYGWIIVGICAASMPIIYGVRHSFSVFFPPILDEFGWSRGSTALMMSLNLFIYGLMAPLAGSMGDRWKPRKVMMIGIAIIALATVGCAFANRLWHFYLFFGVILSVGTALCGWPILGPALTNWFAKRRGLVIGIGQMGGGLSFVYPLFTEFTISRLGWRHAFFVLAGVPIAIVMPLYFFFFNYRPQAKGLKAYGAYEATDDSFSAIEATDTKNAISHHWTLRHALRTHQLWFFLLSFFLSWGIGFYLVLTHQVKFAEDAGYSTMFAASIFALFGIFVTVGQLSTFVSDWIGREKTVTIAAVLSPSALAALIPVSDTSQPWLLYVYSVCFGYGGGLFAATIYAGMADVFHGRNFGAVAGLLLTGMGTGGIIGPWLGGYIYDISGSYTGAFVLSMICFGLACVAFWIAAPRKATSMRTIERLENG